jgi:ATPase family AAA domain-containing protein 3A/B
MFQGMNPFGGSSGKTDPEEDSKKQAKETNNANNSSSGNKGKGTSAPDFNSSGLERAAKAAKELERNSNSKEILRLTAQQEVTKQKELESERAKYSAMQQELAIKRIAEEEAAASRTLEKQTQHNRAQADYQDQLTRRLTVEQMQQQRKMQDEERAKAEESLRRQEEIRKRTIQYEAELRQQTEMARVKAETEGRIKQERSNHDLNVDLKKLEAKEYRETALEGIKQAGSIIGAGLKDFITDKEKLANFAATATILALGVYTAKTGTGIVGRFIEARLGKPSLVRETSKKNFLQIAKSPTAMYHTMRLAFGNANGEEALAMKNIVLEKSLDERLRRVAVSTANTKKNRAPFRHLLLHGPPGTGKTMFAKGLARESGLHYAIMTGGDIAPLGKDAVTEIHKIFDWANTTNKGVMLFVDEADAFLRKRSTERISEDMRNALNAFLYRTGEASHKVMLVYASNQPEQFDWAINDRIDEMVEFSLPGLEERVKMIAQYMAKYLISPEGGSKAITVVDVDEAAIRAIATATEGFSGREISKLAIAWQAAAYGTTEATLSKAMLNDVLAQMKISKQQKKAWLSKEEIQNLVKDRK